MDIASTTSPSVASQNRQAIEPATIDTRSPAAPVEAKTAEPQQPQPSQENTDKAVKQVNDAFLEKQKNLFASIEKDQLTGIAVFKITDKKTNEVIRQLPAREIVSFAQSLAVPQGWRGQLILDKI